MGTLITKPTVDQIRERTEREIEYRLGTFALLKIAFLRVLARVFAGGMYLCYGYAEEFIRKQLLPTTADPEFLKSLHAYLWGVPIHSAVFAVGKVYFIGTNGTGLSVGTVLQYDGNEYTTTEAKTIANGFAEVSIISNTAGVVGNISEDVELELVNPNNAVDVVKSGKLSINYDTLIGGNFSIGDTISNNNRSGQGLIVDTAANNLSVVIVYGSFTDNDVFDNGGGVSAMVNGSPSNNNVISGGADEEDPEILRARVGQRIQEQPAGGAAHDYERWAEEVDGVAKAWTKKATPSPGWVTLIIKAAGSVPTPSSEILAAVFDYISTQDRMPVTADLNVVAIDEAILTMGISITPNTVSIQGSITSNLSSLLVKTSTPGGKTPISQIREAISSSGVTDYVITSITVDGSSVPVDDIVLSGYGYLVPGSISYSTLA